MSFSSRTNAANNSNNQRTDPRGRSACVRCSSTAGAVLSCLTACICGPGDMDIYYSSDNRQHPVDLSHHGRHPSDMSNYSNQSATQQRAGGGGSWCREIFDFVGIKCSQPVFNGLHRFSKSPVYKILYMFFSLFLLFGPAVQDLVAVNKAGDGVFEAVRTTMLAYFVFDFFIKCLTERGYSEFYCFRSGGTVDGANANNAVQGAAMNLLDINKETDASLSFSFGSFLFWCDLVSTGSILYDLSYINPAKTGVRAVEIALKGGIPISGFDAYDRLRPVDLEFNLLVVIARTARCARFVQSRSVVALSNKVNWFWALNQLKWLNPLYHYDRFHSHRQRQQQLNTISSLAVAGIDRSAIGSRDDDRKNSWGVLQIGILAAVHAQAEAEAREAREEANKRGVFGSLWIHTKKALRSIGVLSDGENSAARHQAAIKIQRAWRNHNRSVMIIDGGDFGDIALTSDMENRMSGTSSTPRSRHFNSSDDRALLRRSALTSFSTRNGISGGRLNMSDIRAGRRESGTAPGSRFQSQTGSGRESQVGSDMRQLTAQRVAIGVLFALVCTVLFTFTESNTTQPTTMVVLHQQTQYIDYQYQVLAVARNTSVPELYQYQPVNEQSPIVLLESGIDAGSLRPRDTLVISVVNDNGTSIGWFDFTSDTKQAAWVDIVATVFIITIWFFGVTAFSGPVLLLVITPIERMVHLLGMLMMDPLGYQSTARFKRFLLEEDSLIKNTRWTKEVLKGMETSFLMSTILRIGSLMKVGFGTAGVTIIRNNLEKGHGKNLLILNSQGSTVSCIFLFCDIRQFTDATEQLQEEVFVFTNQIAAVVHSICHSYNGAANKNVGDAFLLSWSLDDGPSRSKSPKSTGVDGGDTKLRAKSNQADKALLSVIKICISLQYDKFYLEPLSDGATMRLKSKLKNRPGPVVQMGFGLHAGKAVQGAIGSQRKIDATYVSEAVERAEFLEASTKKYGLNMLMSGNFHKLLHPNTRRRCRMIDKIFIVDEDEDADEDDDELHGEYMELFTFDMDVEAIHRPGIGSKFGDNDGMSDDGSTREQSLRSRWKGGDRRSQNSGNRQVRNRRRGSSLRTSNPGILASEELALGVTHSNQTVSDGTMKGGGTLSLGQPSVSSFPSNEEVTTNIAQHLPPELVLPTGPALYSHNVWQSPDMKRIRDKYVQGLFFQKFHGGLQAYYNKDWETAHVCFQTVVDGFNDGPSRYFLAEMKRHNWKPPKDFNTSYTVV